MKYFNICLLSVIFAIICSLNIIYAQDEASVPAAKRIAALRRPIGGKAVKTTTTTTKAPESGHDEEEGDYHDSNADNQYDDEHEEGGDASASSTTTTTTEAPKKVGPVIRPFRSNDDFLNSLKRRQQNAKKHNAEKPPSAKPSKRSDSGHDEEGESAASAASPAISAAPAPSKGFKGNSALNRRKPTKSFKPEPAVDDAAAEESEQQQKEETKPKRPIGRLPLRKRN